MNIGDHYTLKLNNEKDMTIEIIHPPSVMNPRFKVVEHLIYFNYLETNEMGVVDESMFEQFVETGYLKKIESK